jgi:hypothetical protein
VRLLRDTCRSIRDLLPLHVGTDLDSGQARRVDEHLHLCLSCFREFRELATMRGRLGVLAEQPLPAGALDDFTEQVMARIAMGEDGPAAELPGIRRRFELPPRSLAAAASLVVALSLGLVLGSQWTTSADPAGTSHPPVTQQSPDVIASAPVTPAAAGLSTPVAPGLLPSLGIPIQDYVTGAGARRGPLIRVMFRPQLQPGLPTISSRDRQLMKANIPELLPVFLEGSSDGLVPDTDPDRTLRPRQAWDLDG